MEPDTGADQMLAQIATLVGTVASAVLVDVRPHVGCAVKTGVPKYRRTRRELFVGDRLAGLQQTVTNPSRTDAGSEVFFVSQGLSKV